MKNTLSFPFTFSPSNPERSLLGPHYEGRLIAVETDTSQNSNEPNYNDPEPLILVHGFSGSIESFANLIPAVSKFSQYQIFYFAYDDRHRSLNRTALELAISLRRLRVPHITVIAHSLGGLVIREALNLLTQSHQPEFLPEIQVIAIDSPWHGEASHGSHYKNSPLDNFLEWFSPAAVVDMKTCSDFFKKLYATTLPEKFSTTLFFAEEGEQAWDYSEGPLKDLPQKIADYISKGKTIAGTLSELYFWQALRSSSQYSYFEVSLHALQKEMPLTAELVSAELLTYFPRLPGNHSSVLAAHPKRKMDLPKYLEQIL